MIVGWVLVGLAVGGIAAWAIKGAKPAQQESPEPARVEEVTAAEVDRFLAPYADRLQASRRPLARVVLEPLPGDDPQVSKVGGRAWWPTGEPAPVDERGAPLHLLAQVNFAELPPMPGYPRRGLVQFFIAANDFYGANYEGDLTPLALSVQRNFRVVYWPDVSTEGDALLPLGGDMLPHNPAKPRRMRFEPSEEPLTVSDYRFGALLGGDAYAAVEAYGKAQQLSAEGLFDALWERHAGGGHKVGGYPGFVQTDPRTGGDWELLLQLDSDDEMMWGDVGVGNFFIAPADLARSDFSRVMYTWDCH